MYFVTPTNDHTGKFAVVKPSPAGGVQPPILIGLYDSEDEAEDARDELNDACGAEDEVEDVPDDLTQFLKRI
jgi:hypothetical protein